MLLYISLFGIFLSLLLLFFNGRNYRASIYLGLYFLFVSIYGIIHYILLWSKSIFLVAIFTTNFGCFAYLIGPLSYLYIRSVITDNARLRRSDAFHFIPMIIFLIAALPNIFSSFEYKTEIARAIIADPNFLGTYEFTFLTKLFSSAVVFLSRPFLILVYALLSGKILFHYFKANRKINTPSGEGCVKNWLITFLGFQFLLVVSHFIYLTESFGIGSSVLSISVRMLNTLSAAGMIGLLVSPLLFPRILYGLPNLINSDYHPAPIEDSIKEELVKKAPAYDDDYMQFIHAKVETAMKDQQVYLQKEYNLPCLSVLIQVPTHHLAYYFSNFKKQTFNDYRNEFRVRHAKLLILQENTGMITLEGIGLSSGFTNRNSFAKAFKNIEGVTPSVFAAQNKK